MSENEKLRREEYKKNRTRWILIQTIALIALLAMTLGFFTIYNRLSRTYYIEYSDTGSVDYRVWLKDNDFFEEDFVGKDHSYVAALIEGIEADFAYNLGMSATDVPLDYTYSIAAQVIISNKYTNQSIISPTYELIPETAAKASGGQIALRKSVALDYITHNAFAAEFLDTYDLASATASLVVSMHVNVASSCDRFEENYLSSYTTTLHIPLVEENFSIHSTSTTPPAEPRVLACNDHASQDLFFGLTIAGAVLSALLAITLAIYVALTRNEDINYTNTIRRMLSAYRSFIQQIDGVFDATGYQIVPIKTFNEMLSIRDTLQSPILMYENEDRTMTEFLITTNTQILYTFVVKVENYDELYGGNDAE